MTTFRSLRAMLAAVSETVSEGAKALAALHADVATLKTTVASVHADLGALNGRLEKVENAQRGRPA